MDKSLNEKKEELLLRFSQMPEKIQRALLWLIGNYDDACDLCRNKKLTEEERIEAENFARKRDDPLLLALVIMERILNDEG